MITTTPHRNGPMVMLWRLFRRRRLPYDWRSERECEALWDDLPRSHVKVLR